MAAIGLAMALTCTMVAPAHAQRKDSYRDKIEQERKNLEKLRGSIEEKKKRAGEVEKKRGSVLQGIQSLDERLVRYRHDHQEIRKKLKKKDREIEDMYSSSLRRVLRDSRRA